MNVILNSRIYRDVVGLRQSRSSKLYRAILDNGGRATAVVLKFAADGLPIYPILKELRALQSIKHPGIINFLGGSTDPVPHVVVEHIKGGITLDEILKILPRTHGFTMPQFNELLASFVIREIALSLSAVHQSGFIHGDIKPSNIIFTSKGEAKLIDFGFSNPISEPAHQHRQAYGSLHYSDPLQLEGFWSEKVNFAQDLYPLGIILFELAFRRQHVRLRKGLSTEEQRDDVLQMLRVDKFSIPYRTFPEWIETVMGKTCRYNFRKRCSSAGDVLELMDPNSIPMLSRDEFAIYLAGIKSKLRNKRTLKIPPPTTWLTQQGIQTC